MIYYSDTSPYLRDMGKFRILFHMPGEALKGHTDHGYGPLATVAESYMDPDTWITMHPHTNDEIISWVPDGVMRHNDPVTGELITDKDHIMIMNAGKGFWHEEKTLADDPPLRMLQIFVRPYALNLKAKIQHGPLVPWEYNQWRKVFGQEDSGSDYYVRNDIEMYDIRTKAGATVQFVNKPGYDVFFMVYNGEIKINEHVLGFRKSGILKNEDALEFTSTEESLIVAFLINPTAAITKEGTIGQ